MSIQAVQQAVQEVLELHSCSSQRGSMRVTKGDAEYAVSAAGWFVGPQEAAEIGKLLGQHYKDVFSACIPPSPESAALQILNEAMKPSLNEVPTLSSYEPLSIKALRWGYENFYDFFIKYADET